MESVTDITCMPQSLTHNHKSNGQVANISPLLSLCYGLMASVFTEHQKHYLVEIYFENGGRINGDWVYSCIPKFSARMFRYSCNPVSPLHSYSPFWQLIRETGSMDRKKSGCRSTIRHILRFLCSIYTKS